MLNLPSLLKASRNAIQSTKILGEVLPKNPLTTRINTYIMNPAGASLLDRHPRM